MFIICNIEIRVPKESKKIKRKHPHLFKSVLSFKNYWRMIKFLAKKVTRSTFLSPNHLIHGVKYESL